MKVFLAGATGFIGGGILRGLLARGHEVTCLVREGGAARALEAQALAGVRLVRAPFAEPPRWTAAVAGHDAVVNAVGIIREGAGAGASFAALHRDAPKALFDAAKAGGARKVVQVSALGVERDPVGATGYGRTKREADEHLAGLGIPYVILRPSFVYGPGDASMTFFASLAALPVIPVPGGGAFLVQPIAIEDLVRAAVRAVEDDAIRDRAIECGGAEPISFRDLLAELARWLGRRRAPLVALPWPLLGAAARAADLVGRGPINGDELRMLAAGSRVADGGAAFESTFGFRPLAFAAGLARKPCSEADRWHARLLHLRLPLRLMVAFIWIATGLISALVYPEADSLALLRAVGVEGALARWALYGTAWAEVGLGVLTALGVWPVAMGACQLALMAGFTGILSAGVPELWVHPFGPLTKNVPLVGATLAMMALEAGAER